MRKSPHAAALAYTLLGASFQKEIEDALSEAVASVDEPTVDVPHLHGEPKRKGKPYSERTAPKRKRNRAKGKKPRN